jgi:hypothetical protein
MPFAGAEGMVGAGGAGVEGAPALDPLADGDASLESGEPQANPTSNGARTWRGHRRSRLTSLSFILFPCVGAGFRIPTKVMLFQCPPSRRKLQATNVF